MSKIKSIIEEIISIEENYTSEVVTSDQMQSIASELSDLFSYVIQCSPPSKNKFQVPPVNPRDLKTSEVTEFNTLFKKFFQIIEKRVNDTNQKAYDGSLKNNVLEIKTMLSKINSKNSGEFFIPLYKNFTSLIKNVDYYLKDDIQTKKVSRFAGLGYKIVDTSDGDEEGGQEEYRESVPDKESYNKLSKIKRILESLINNEVEDAF